MSVSPVPPDYYVDFLLQMVRWVEARHRRLLRADDRHWCRRLRTMADDPRRLYVRLLQRKGPLFRIERLQYPEVRDTARAVDALVDCGLLARRPWLPNADLLALLTLPELRRLFADQRLTGCRRSEAIDVLLSLPADAVRARIAAAIDWCAPLGRLAFERVQLAFFGNQRQTLTEFITADLGIVRYPDYRVGGGLFADRHDVDARLEVDRLQPWNEHFGRTGNVDGLLWCRQRLPGAMGGEWTRARAARLDTRIGRWLERCNAHALALEVYQRAGTAQALERSVRIMRRAGRTLEASALALQACSAELSDDGVRETLQGLVEPARRRRGGPRDEVMWLQQDADVSVECAVAAALGARGLTAIHAENSIMATLFALTFWDVLYADVPGAFVHGYQHAPLDLFDGGFHRRRRELIATPVDEVRRHGALPRMAGTRAMAAPVHWQAGGCRGRCSKRLPRDCHERPCAPSSTTSAGMRAGHAAASPTLPSSVPASPASSR